MSKIKTESRRTVVYADVFAVKVEFFLSRLRIEQVRQALDEFSALQTCAVRNDV